MTKHKILTRNLFYCRHDWGHDRGFCHHFSLGMPSLETIREMQIRELQGYAWGTSTHELVDWRSQFGSHLFFLL